ncbi:MAG: hypothetical protein ACO2PP_14590 [Thermocrinis sp.]|uniref:hypothetical protein n=1 Tax=Thermocrinis sp. TaxID=2024383 RepID=UPI003C08E358
MMWEANSHGAGFCVWDEKSRTWIMKKGFMKFEALWNEVEPYTREGSILVVHFRIVSRGRVCPEQTHPFEIKLEEGVAYLFHNGTLEIQITQGSSDTFELAYRLSQLGLNKKQLKLLLREGGLLERVRAHSRFAVCLPDEEEPFLVGQWEEVGGLKVSNSYWCFGRTYTGLSKSRRSFYSYYPLLLWEEEWEEKEDLLIVEVGALRFKVEDGVAYPYFGNEFPSAEGEIIPREDGLFLVFDGLSYEIKPSYKYMPRWALDPDGVLYRLDNYRLIAYPVGGKRPKQVAIGLRDGDVLYVLDETALAVPYEVKEEDGC